MRECGGKEDVPAISTARRANPLYRSTKESSTMPVPLLMTMATKSGVQPSVRRWRTFSLRFVTIAQLGGGECFYLHPIPLE